MSIYWKFEEFEFRRQVLTCFVVVTEVSFIQSCCDEDIDALSYQFMIYYILCFKKSVNIDSCKNLILSPDSFFQEKVSILKESVKSSATTVLF